MRNPGATRLTDACETAPGRCVSTDRRLADRLTVPPPGRVTKALQIADKCNLTDTLLFPIVTRDADGPRRRSEDGSEGSLREPRSGAPGGPPRAGRAPAPRPPSGMRT